MTLRSAKRLLWLAVTFFVLLSALGVRAFYLHLIEGPALARAAYGQRTDLLRLDQRGLILDRNGLPLTNPLPRWYLAYFPSLVREERQVLAAVEEALSLPPYSLEVTGSPDPRLLRALTATEASLITALELPGVAVAPRTERYGPDALARHTVGYLSDSRGAMGLERAFDEALHGTRAPYLAATYDGRGRTLDGLGVKLVTPDTGKPPYDVHTTLDLRMQRALERTLDTFTAPEGGTLRAGAVLLEPVSGELLAMASRPEWDQNQVPDNWVLQTTNRAVTAYPPGSIFKTIVAAAALEAGLVTPDEHFFCEGHYTVGDQVFHDDNDPHGELTFQEAIARSCNVVFAKVGLERLGPEAMRDAMVRFGLGMSTGSGLPEESAGRLPAMAYGGDVAQAAFGQADLEVTPLQMARAYAAVAGGGVLPHVRLVNTVRTKEGEVIARTPKPGGQRILSRTTAQQLQDGLLAVTHPDGVGTGRPAWVAEGGSAGKTGSAEGVMDGEQTTHAWFAGYFPAHNPRYVLVVFVEGGQYGGSVAGPIFAAAARAILAVAP